MGRWITEDPAGRVDGPNLYTYVVNDPIRLVDPFGDKAACCECSYTVKCRSVGTHRGIPLGIIADHCYLSVTEQDCSNTTIESGENPNTHQNQANATKGTTQRNDNVYFTWHGQKRRVDCKVIDCMKQAVANWNSANHRYDAVLGPNSNGFISWILKECGKNDPPPLFSRTPGWY
jgi:uncharacterized protein RhaS with RHS repeats